MWVWWWLSLELCWLLFYKEKHEAYIKERHALHMKEITTPHGPEGYIKNKFESRYLCCSN